eukprot:scaffold23463_cov59-Phaeocystis_antarctica.AAC.4
MQSKETRRTQQRVALFRLLSTLVREPKKGLVDPVAALLVLNYRGNYRTAGADERYCRRLCDEDVRRSSDFLQRRARPTSARSLGARWLNRSWATSLTPPGQLAEAGRT